MERDMVCVMIDNRIGKRIKQCRERLGLTQEQFAEKTGFTANYISTLERGASFPRCEKLITLLNALEVSADAIFCDVVDHSTKYKANKLSEELETLPLDAQKPSFNELRNLLCGSFFSDINRHNSSQSCAILCISE